ncbi:MAG: CpaF family protein, partial [Anaerolinea sp.]|nr:CpaF family protein [Anaerolinea sp.]
MSSLLGRLKSGGTGSTPPSGGESGPVPPEGGAEGSRLAAMRSQQALAGRAPSRPDSGYADLKTRVQSRLLQELDQAMDLNRKNEVRAHIEELFNAIIAEESIAIARAERERLFNQVVAEILGFGPLEPLLADETITE